MKQVILLLALVMYYTNATSQYNISGTVENIDGEPLTGANVVLENTYKGATTGINGEFLIPNVNAGNYTLLVSYMGYQSISEPLQVDANESISLTMEKTSVMADEVIVSATRAKGDHPVAFTNMNEQEIEKKYIAQDLPYLLNMTPSLVTTSDAGAGIGYTTFRVRGTAQQRINIMVNGIPINDAESHGVWFVNMPDFAGSVDNIQVQRGVGTSVNGAAAFGATLNMQTTTLNKEPFAEINSAIGSFNTIKNNVTLSSGLIDNKFTFDARLSKITSDGYIDRATSDLKSFFVSGGYYSEKSVLRMNVFSGKEITYQAWNGVPGYLLDSIRAYNGIGQYTDADGNIRYYDNQVDNYQQDHFQLLYSREFNRKWYMNLALHYTHGEGFYEEYKEQEDFGAYQMNPIYVGTGKDSILKYDKSAHAGMFAGNYLVATDLVRRKWLDNDFYGATWALNYKNDRLTAILGGGWNNYDGDHFGNVIWARYMSLTEKGHQWYNGNGLKIDFNTYLRLNYHVLPSFSLFGDMQYRNIDYNITGIDDDSRDISQSHYFNFFNPKFGFSYVFNPSNHFYFSYSVGNREPTRSNYTDADPNQPYPTHETLNDYELGYKFNTKIFFLNTNFYFMDYTNQLVLTGEINDVGAPIMTNVKDSYRAGVEIISGIILPADLRWNLNATFSQNKILNYTEYIDNWSYWSDPENEPLQVKQDLGETDLAFSPEIIAGSEISYNPLENLEVSLLSKYVGSQYIDNTSSELRKLDAYFVNDLRLNYLLTPPFMKEINLSLAVNNIFNEMYVSNAWVYKYFFEGEQLRLDGFYPQAGTNFLLAVSLKF